MLWANRNGFFYVLDRATGQFLLGKPFVEVNWASGFDEKGRPMRVPGKLPTAEGTVIFAGQSGRHQLVFSFLQPEHRVVLHPLVGELFVGVHQSSGRIRQKAADSWAHLRDRWWVGSSKRKINTRKDNEGYGAVRAIDPQTGERKWEFKMNDVTDAGILTTASDLLFSGGREGYFYALDARNGELLWKANVGGAVASGPMSYAVNGKQYVAISAGSALFVYALKE